MRNSLLLFRDITAVSLKSAWADHITTHHIHIHLNISTSGNGELYTMIVRSLHYCRYNIIIILLTPGNCNVYRHRSSDVNFPFISNTCSVVSAILCLGSNSFIFFLSSPADSSFLLHPLTILIMEEILTFMSQFFF